LKDEITASLLRNDIQAKERVTQVIKDAHEEDEVPLAVPPGKIVDLTTFEAATVTETEKSCCPLCLGNEMRIAVNS
jgi:hypothetical protein